MEPFELGKGTGTHTDTHTLSGEEGRRRQEAESKREGGSESKRRERQRKKWMETVCKRESEADTGRWREREREKMGGEEGNGISFQAFWTTKRGVILGVRLFFLRYDQSSSDSSLRPLDSNLKAITPVSLGLLSRFTNAHRVGLQRH